MIQKICVFTFVFIFSSCAFSSNDFSTVTSSVGNGNNKQYQKKSNKGKDKHDLWYNRAFTKIEEVIESQDESLSKIPFLNEENQNQTNHADIIKQIEDKLDTKDYLSILKLSFYYAEDEKLNKAIEYFDIACTLEASKACELYKQQLKQPKKNKIYSLLRKFDKNNPDIKLSLAIAKWYEDLGKNLTAINYYSYAIDKDPKLLLKMVELLKTANIESSSELEMAIIKTYIKYDSYIDDAEIKYKIFELYFYPSSFDSFSEKQKIGMYWLEKAAEAGHILAKLKIAEEYKSGHYLEQNFTKSLYWFNSYCNDLEDTKYLAYCPPFINKENEITDLVTKANNGDMEAQFNLGMRLVDAGILYEIGLYYLKQAADQGHTDAILFYRIFEHRRSMNFSG